MSYWNDMSEQARSLLNERPHVTAYANDELFSRWVKNLTPDARGVICNVRALRGSQVCAF